MVLRSFDGRLPRCCVPSMGDLPLLPPLPFPLSPSPRPGPPRPVQRTWAFGMSRMVCVSFFLRFEDPHVEDLGRGAS